MTDVKRYDEETPGGYGNMFEDIEGDYVKHSDYQALQAENERLKRDNLILKEWAFEENKPKLGDN